MLVRHPLQPFDARNFVPGELVADRTWSFDAVDARGRPRAGGRARAGRPVPARSAARSGRRRSSSSTTSCGSSSARRARSCASAWTSASRDYSDEVADALSVELGGLEEWGVGNRIVEGLLAGAAMDDCVAAELARGALPPGRLALPVIARVRPVVERDRGRGAGAARGRRGSPARVDVRVALADGRGLGGTVAGVCGDVLRTVTYSRLSARHRLAVWVRLLALTAAHPERPFEAVTVGRARSGAPDGARITVSRIRPVGAERARGRRSSALVDLWDRGLREPLPIACQTSAAYAAARETEARRREGRARGVGVGLGVPEGGRRARAPARLRREARRSTS